MPATTDRLDLIDANVLLDVLTDDAVPVHVVPAASSTTPPTRRLRDQRAEPADGGAMERRAVDHAWSTG